MKSTMATLLPDSSFILEHAGPYPIGATYAADIPAGMTLAQIGAELLDHGHWILGGLWRGKQWEQFRIETARSEGLDDFVDFEIFTLGPGTDPIAFALAIEWVAIVRGGGGPYLVLTLYLDGRTFASTPWEPRTNLFKFQDVFSKAAKALRSGIDRYDGYPSGISWDPKTGKGRVN